MDHDGVTSGSHSEAQAGGMNRQRDRLLTEDERCALTMTRRQMSGRRPATFAMLEAQDAKSYAAGVAETEERVAKLVEGYKAVIEAQEQYMAMQRLGRPSRRVGKVIDNLQEKKQALADLKERHA